MAVRNIRRQSTVPGVAVANSAPIYVDSDDNKLKMIPAGSGTTEIELVDVSTAQTITGVKTFGAGSVAGTGIIQVATVNLDGATWHTGVGGADFLSWTAPAAVVIMRLLVNITTKSTGAATADIGTTAVSNITNGDNLIDAIDIGSAATVYSNLGATDTEKREVTLASGAWVTFHALADPTGTVGKAYIFYFTL